jgi:hypothetical protein
MPRTVAKQPPLSAFDSQPSLPSPWSHHPRVLGANVRVNIVYFEKINPQYFSFLLSNCLPKQRLRIVEVLVGNSPVNEASMPTRHGGNFWKNVRTARRFNCRRT